MTIDIYKTGTMVRPLFLESKGHLKSLFNNLKFTTSGTKHTYKRLLVFSSFVKAILEDREHQIYYSVGKAGYDAKRWPVSYNAFIKVEKELVRLGWIRKVPNQVAKFGFAPRRIASDSFLDQLPEDLEFKELSYKEPDFDPLSLIVINKLKRTPAERAKGIFPRPPQHSFKDRIEAQERVRKLNKKALATHTYENLKRPFRGWYRSFNGYLGMGGRLYAAYQQMSEKKNERAQILIDGEKVVEIDIQASQPTILHAKTYPGKPIYDFYSAVKCRSLNRKGVKAIVIRAIGNGGLPVEKFPQGLRKELKVPKKIKWTEVRQAILKGMPFLERLEPRTLDWGKLMLWESNVFMSVLERILDEGYGVLVVHDSIIVPVSGRNRCAEILADEFEKQIGVRPVLWFK